MQRGLSSGVSSSGGCGSEGDDFNSGLSGESNIMVTVRVRPILGHDAKKANIVHVLDKKVSSRARGGAGAVVAGLRRGQDEKGKEGGVGREVQWQA